ncbi:hypothetical protein D3C80_1135650 [compost metagenome]
MVRGRRLQLRCQGLDPLPHRWRRLPAERAGEKPGSRRLHQRPLPAHSPGLANTHNQDRGQRQHHDQHAHAALRCTARSGTGLIEQRQAQRTGKHDHVDAQATAQALPAGHHALIQVGRRAQRPPGVCLQLEPGPEADQQSSQCQPAAHAGHHFAYAYPVAIRIEQVQLALQGLPRLDMPGKLLAGFPRQLL